MSAERFLVTGALGCIGAWTACLLVKEGVPVTAFDLGANDSRLRLIMQPEELERIAFVRGDVTDLEALEHTLAEHEITNVVHLAALQVPFCKADPPLGASVNVVGTVNVFEAVKRRGLSTTVAYASSAAVYDAHGELSPRTLYGVYKLANEETARVYHQDDGVASIGLRPFCVYGPGRDQGLTSTPTLAMHAAAQGEPYRISFGGRTQFHYAPDVAAAFIRASRTQADSADVYDLGGPAVHMSELVRAIEAAAPAAAGTITFDDVPLPFPERLPGEELDLAQTPLEEGVRQTIELFRVQREASAQPPPARRD
ncbi:MAG TPA: NAD(P)-dependent oxidoreductase [Gaiellaceae bacterium]|nr:NAD(P)-dependent oxidoreductase [Gaiellaceae bacterium]